MRVLRCGGRINPEGNTEKEILHDGAVIVVEQEHEDDQAAQTVHPNVREWAQKKRNVMPLVGEMVMMPLLPIEIGDQNPNRKIAMEALGFARSSWFARRVETSQSLAEVCSESSPWRSHLRSVRHLRSHKALLHFFPSF